MIEEILNHKSAVLLGTGMILGAILVIVFTDKTVDVKKEVTNEQTVEHEANGDHNAAIAIWHQLLGDDFPKPDYTQAINTLVAGGGVTGGAIVSKPKVAPKTTRSWRPHA